MNKKPEKHQEGGKIKGITKEYRSYALMKSRCYNPNNKDYKYYGNKNIVVCKEWLDSYKQFLKDMGRAPSKKHTLDRIDTNNNYCKENCRWATRQTQSINRNKLKNNKSGITGVSYCKITNKWTVYISINKKNTYLGRFKTLEEAAKIRKKAEQTYYKKIIENNEEDYAD